jgi:hypothetical protein
VRIIRGTLLSVFLVGSLVWVPGANAGTACAWTDATASAFSSSTVPLAVDATSSTNAWIVGASGVAATQRPRFWLWNGSTWSAETVPRLLSGTQTLRGVDAVATDDAWAVGSSSAPGRAMIIHWDGAQWRLSRGPRFTHASDLRGIVQTGSDRAWAVGSAGTRGVVLRWNGARWHRTQLPFTNRSPALSAIAAVSRHDVWAVGTIREPGTDPALRVTNPVAIHWDGSSWSQVRLPHAGAFPESLASVSARASDDAWAVGATSDENASANPGLIYHWNGTRCSHVLPPFIGSGQNRLTGVTAPASDAAWVVGEDDGGTGMPIALVWNGAAWSSDTLPTLPGDMGFMSGVVVLPSNDGWATGSYWSSSRGGPSGPLVLDVAC